MSTEDRQAYVDDMVTKRGYILDYHKVMAKQDWDVLVAANGLVEACYLKERTLDRKTKELLFILSLVVMRASKGHIQSHIKAGLDAGLSSREILEAIELSLPEAGVVVFQHGFECWKEMVDVDGIEPTVEAFSAVKPPAE